MTQELEELRELHQDTLLKLEHYKQKVAAQEDQIGDLRVEITKLGTRLQEAYNPHVPPAPTLEPTEPVDAELVD